MTEIQIASNKFVINKYPFLYNGKNYEWTWRDQVIPSYLARFELMCNDIKKACEENQINDLYFIEVKEKYNQMRIYTNTYYDVIENIIDSYWQGIWYGERKERI